MNTRNYGLPLLPYGVTIMFPDYWEWEKCRTWLKQRGVKLTSGSWDCIRIDLEKFSSPMMEFICAKRVKLWRVKPLSNAN